MSTATKAFQFVDTVQKQGIKKEAAKEIVRFIEEQRGELVTKQDVEPLNQKLEWLKWIVGIDFTVGLGLLLTVTLYLHNNTNERLDRIEAEMKEIKELLRNIKG